MSAKIQLSKGPFKLGTGSCILVFTFTEEEKEKQNQGSGQDLPVRWHLPQGQGLTSEVKKYIEGCLQASSKQKSLTGKKKEYLFFRSSNEGESTPHLLLIGLGKLSPLKHEDIRKAVAGAYQRLSSNKIEQATLLMESFPSFNENEENKALFVRAAVEGFHLAQYSPALGKQVLPHAHKGKGRNGNHGNHHEKAKIAHPAMAQSPKDWEKITEHLLFYTQDALHTGKRGKEEGNVNPDQSKSPNKLKTLSLQFEESDAPLWKTSSKTPNNNPFQSAYCLAKWVNFARTLADMPANWMTPHLLAHSVQEGVHRYKLPLEVEVWDGERIRKEGMGGLYGVSLGGPQPPRFIIMKYNGSGKEDRPLCFVGKGLTFDSGGVSIKPSAHMEEMKYDMCGATATIGTLMAIAELKLEINAVGLIPSSENMTGGGANKPGDILVARNGVSFEVNNTDAEGRLILADALSYASELNPSFIVDAATLTGAMLMALGNIHTGYFTHSEALNEKIQEASHHSGEWIWRMPLTEFHVEDMKGTFADLSNISKSKGAGSATGAAFLEQFVDPSIPWAHFDIAGTAWDVANRLPYCRSKGASGVMVRTFVELAKTYI